MREVDAHAHQADCTAAVADIAGRLGGVEGSMKHLSQVRRLLLLLCIRGSFRPALHELSQGSR